MSQIEVRPDVYTFAIQTHAHTDTFAHLHTCSICARIRGPNNRANTGCFGVGRMCVCVNCMKMVVRSKICRVKTRPMCRDDHILLSARKKPTSTCFTFY